MKLLIIFATLLVGCGPLPVDESKPDAGLDAGSTAARGCRTPTPTGYSNDPVGKPCDLIGGATGSCDGYGACQ